MPIVIVTGSAGLIGAEACRFFAAKGLDIVGVDNDMRRYFFGPEGSTAWSRRKLRDTIPGYKHFDIDIRDQKAVEGLFRKYGKDIVGILHTAAQPSHDWAAREPFTDFSINASGTLNLLEFTRRHASDAVFMFTSTNKVYGDSPNRLPLIELEKRWELDPTHPYSANGIPESMSIDGSLHSLFGASKVAADVLVQEYGRYFGLKTVCFRGGCLTGPGHSGVELHGFLSYLVTCALTGKAYTVFGYRGKQVRDNIHAFDLVNAFWHFFRAPRVGEVYNIGGGRASSCSMVEAIDMCQTLAGKRMNWSYKDSNRIGDHIWWITDTGKFRQHYPDWSLNYTIRSIIEEILENLRSRLGNAA